MVVAIEPPPISDNTTPCSSRQAGFASSSISTRTSTPLPAGIVAPVNEKARTVLTPVDIVNPAFAAAPPEAPVTVAPSILN